MFASKQVAAQVNARFNEGLLDFIRRSPTPFHAAANMAESLRQAGYEELEEAASWSLEKGGRYFVLRNGSALVAFTLGEKDIFNHGMRLTGAHTDSPCLKIKPQPEISAGGYLQLGFEVYGGALLNPWFDRDLSIAGRVDFLNAQHELQSCLVDLEKPVAVIPSLAIHLDREANQNRSVNPQKDMPPILQLHGDARDFSLDDFIRDHINNEPGARQVRKVLAHELMLYDTQPPALVGLKDEFIAAARLDNLLSCYVSLQALMAGGSEDTNLMVCNDHEEVGSASASGAQGPFLNSVLERIVGKFGHSSEAFARLISNSEFISLDNAHGVHPNYADKHDSNHGPLLNGGPVIKLNANQRYASNSTSTAFFKNLCQQLDIPLQSFAMRSDMACGSTIGPITATSLGVSTLDVGVPTFAMHSIRELAGTEDAWHLFRAISRFYGQD